MDDFQDKPRFKKDKRPIHRPAESFSVPENVLGANPFDKKEEATGKEFEVGSYIGDDDNNIVSQEFSENEAFDKFFAENEAPQTMKDRFIVGNLYTKMALITVGIAALILGIFFAKLFLTKPALVQNGLQGVIINAEVPRGKARCGVAEKTQGCVLYIMNPQRQELNGRDFYDLAAQLSGRQRFTIETSNMRYASVIIRPGEIAQINIPPLQ